jgi:DNA-binding ferritin-like protein
MVMQRKTMQRKTMQRSVKRTKQGAKKTMRNTNSKKIYQQIVYCFMQLLSMVKLYHWKTTDYPTHKATDDLYADLNTKVDQFVEVLLGKPSSAGSNRAYILHMSSIKLPALHNNIGMKRTIESYKAFMINLTNNAQFNQGSNVDLLAIRDEILATLNQFLYLLTLH